MTAEGGAPTPSPGPDPKSLLCSSALSGNDAQPDQHLSLVLSVAMEGETLVCVPGQRLSIADKSHLSGRGTYERLGYIYATLAGVVKVEKQDKASLIEVRSSNEQSIVPAPGDIVTAKITLVKQRFCKCIIKCIGDTVLSRPYRGMLRKEDVRATEKDKVEMIKCFRPGDIILARVLPMTEVHSYQLSTAEDELGVVLADSEEGMSMVPVSWTEMQCPKTHIKELRKVAKVLPERLGIE